jgi:hypothetical protein
MNLIKKIILLALAFVLLIVLSYQGYLTVRYRLHNDHKELLSEAPVFEKGTPFIPRSGGVVEGMALAAETPDLQLYVDTDTGNIALYDRRSGSLTYAVPPDADEDPRASDRNKRLLKSQLSIDYFTADRDPATMNSFEHSVSIGDGEQVELQSLANGLRVIYTLGDLSSPTGIVPLYIRADDLDKLFAPMESLRDYRNSKANYTESTVAPGFMELRTSVRTQTQTLADMERHFAALGYTEERRVADMEASGVEMPVPLHFIVPVDFRLDGDGLVVSVDTEQIVELGDSEGRISRIQLMRAFNAGNRMDDCTGCEKCVVIETVSVSENTDIDEDLQADEDTDADEDLEADGDTDETADVDEIAEIIETPIDMDCRVLVQETGYIVLPNGSGSLIRFNNGRSDVDEYRQYIYGKDPLLKDYTVRGNTETIRLPFFGIMREDTGYLIRVESGDTMTEIIAGVAGRFNSYNYAYPNFELRGSMELEMFGVSGQEAKLPVVERDLPATRLSVRYTPLGEGYDGYSGMAKRAREQLLEEGTLSLGEDTQDIPFYMDLIGSVKGQKFVAGISYMGQIPMTTYKEAEEIVNHMNSLGVQRQVVNYQGWYNRGYFHDVADKIKPVGALGRVKDLESLSKSLEANGGKLYSDTAFQTVPFTSRRYRYTMESSRYYGGGVVAAFGAVNPVTLYNTYSLGYREVMYNLLSPRFLTRYTESYIKASSRYGVTGTSLRDLGDVLASDRRRTNLVNREQAKEIVLHSFDLLNKTGKPLMVSGGNLYSLAYASDLINAPIAHSALNIVDEEIPFFAMIVRGCVDYAGAPINLGKTINLKEKGKDYYEIVLRLIEHGASPHFTFTSQNATDMKYTGLNTAYSTHYLNWSQVAAEIYHDVNEVLGPLSGYQMVRHEIHGEGLRSVTYSNGTTIIINYTDSVQHLDGDAIPSMYYILKEGAA